MTMKILPYSLFVLITSCAHQSPDKKIDTATITYSNGYHDEYSSEYEILTRYTCKEHPVFANAKLKPEILRTIGNIAFKEGFFELPKILKLEPQEFDEHGNEIITIVAPCPDFALTINYLEHSNTVTWTCNHGYPPPQLHKVITYLNEQIYSLPSVKSLRESECRHR